MSREITNISKEELEKFILDQSPSRKINFEEATYKDSCGCLFIHYAKFLGLKEPVATSTRAWDKAWDNTRTICFKVLFDAWGIHHKTYQTLQEEVKKKQTT